jgi:predicted MFS family arabinose efflux permease
VALSPVLLRESRDSEHGRRFDVAGAVTITGALVALVYAVVEAPREGWASGQTLGLLALSAALIALFVAVEARSAAPLAPLRLFRSRALVGGNLVLFALGMLAFGMPFTLTQYAQDVLHYSPLEFGLASVVMPVTAALGSIGGQGIATRGGLRSVATVGLALTGLGCLLLTQVSVDGSYLGDIFFGLLVFGPGLGATYVAGSIGSLAGVAEADAGLASGLNNSSFQIGGAVGVAIVSSVAVSQAEGADPLVALTNGFQSAFATAIVFAAVGLLAAVTLLGKLRAPAPAPTAEPAAEAG